MWLFRIYVSNWVSVTCFAPSVSKGIKPSSDRGIKFNSTRIRTRRMIPSMNPRDAEFVYAFRIEITVSIQLDRASENYPVSPLADPRITVIRNHQEPDTKSCIICIRQFFIIPSNELLKLDRQTPSRHRAINNTRRINVPFRPLRASFFSPRIKRYSPPLPSFLPLLLFLLLLFLLFVHCTRPAIGKSLVKHTRKD